MILFSVANNAFYDSELEERYTLSGSWPDDLIEISKEDHLIYSGQIPEGKELGSLNGVPEWVDAEVIVYVPSSVTMRQARLALLSTGRLADVETAIAEMSEPDKSAATIEWEYSQTVERNRPFVLTLGALLGLSETQLDDLFILAATL